MQEYTPNMRRVKAAVIGAGFMGRVHSEAIRRLGHVDLVAVAAGNAKEGAAFADTFGIERSTADYRELLADPAIDAVHVCTPNALHYPVTKAALEAGKAVV